MSTATSILTPRTRRAGGAALAAVAAAGVVFAVTLPGAGHHGTRAVPVPAAAPYNALPYEHGVPSLNPNAAPASYPGPDEGGRGIHYGLGG
ncbi:MAG: hypothetical protein ACXVRH_07080 [Thermoleophilaceae bacterium]